MHHLCLPHLIAENLPRVELNVEPMRVELILDFLIILILIFIWALGSYTLGDVDTDGVMKKPSGLVTTESCVRLMRCVLTMWPILQGYI